MCKFTQESGPDTFLRTRVRTRLDTARVVGGTPTGSTISSPDICPDTERTHSPSLSL